MNNQLNKKNPSKKPVKNAQKNVNKMHKNRNGGFFTPVVAIVIMFVAICVYVIASQPHAASGGSDDCLHSYNEYKVAATCVDGGYTRYSCDKCGDVHIKDRTEPVGHAPGEWEIITEANKDCAGTMERKCERCGKVLSTARYVNEE